MDNVLTKRHVMAKQLLDDAVSAYQKGDSTAEEVRSILVLVNKNYVHEGLAESIEAANKALNTAREVASAASGYQAITSFKDANSKKPAPQSNSEAVAIEASTDSGSESGKTTGKKDAATKTTSKKGTKAEAEEPAKKDAEFTVDEALLTEETLQQVPDMEAAQILELFNGVEGIIAAAKHLGISLDVTKSPDDIADDFSIALAAPHVSKK